MIEITIKTLDSQNHVFSVGDDLTVKQLKEHIAEPVNVPVESQRLIYCGRVLLDEKKLSEYDVNGKVIHLVQRAPPSGSGGGGESRNSQQQRRAWRGLPARVDGGNAMYLGAMAFPADLIDAQGITLPQPRHSLSQSRLSIARLMLRRVRNTLNNLENPPAAEQPADVHPLPETPSHSGEASSATNGSTTEEGAASPGEVRDLVEQLARGITGSAVNLCRRLYSASGLVPGPEEENIFRNMTAAAVAVARNFEVSGSSSQSGEAQEGDTSGGGSGEPPESAGSSELPENLNTVAHEEEVTSEPTEDTANDPSGSSSGGNGSESNARSRYPNTTVLADLMNQVKEINQRLQPFMEQYYNLMRNDPADVNAAEAQSVFNQVSEMMHFMAHAYHALSDIMCDFSQQPPRFLRCRPVLIHHSAVLQTGIPIQVQMINLSQSGSNQTGSSTGSQTENQQAGGETEATAAATAAATAPASPNEEPARPPNNLENLPTTSNQSNTTSTSSQGGDTTTLNIGPNNFEIFMDVGSGSITLDSIEATVVTNDLSRLQTPNSENQSANIGISGNFPWGPPPTEFIQNLIHRLTGEIGTNNINNNNNNNNNIETASSNNNNSNGSTEERREEGGGEGQSQPRNSTGPNPTTSTSQPRTAPRPHVHLASGMGGQAIDIFDPFLPCNSHHIRRRRGNANGGTEELNRSTGSEESRPAEQSESQPSANRFPRITRLFSAQPVSRESLPHRVEHIVQRLPRDVMMNLQASTGSSTLMNSISEVLESIPGYTHSPGESLITDFFMTAGRHITLLDIFSNFNSSLYSAMRPSLRQYISDNFSMQTYSDESATVAVERINAEIRPFFQTIEGITIREGVDLGASMCQVVRHFIPLLLREVLEGDEPRVESISFTLTDFVQTALSVILYASQGGHTVPEVITALSRQLVRSTPMSHRGWLGSEVSNQLRRFVLQPNILEMRYIVPTKPSRANTDQQAMETDSLEDMSLNSLRDHSSDTIGSEPWHQAVPPDWVPIITRDKREQRRAAAQGPLSDTYLAGMPSKRRKLVTDRKPHGSITRLITESMTVALEAAGVGGSRCAGVADNAASDYGLRSAFKKQVRTSVESTLRNHPDYHPDKYPNAAEYLKRLYRQ